MIFENSQIETEALPSVDNIEFQKLSPAYRKVEYIGTSIFFAFLLIGCFALLFVLPEEYKYLSYIAFGLWALLYGIGLYIAGKQYDMAGYAIREHDVIHKHGLYWHTVTTIPYNRMQHVEISQGPVQNAFQLATLRVFTAGGTSSDLSIDGLRQQDAQRIKDFIANKISGDNIDLETFRGRDEQDPRLWENRTTPSAHEQPVEKDNPIPPSSPDTDRPLES